MPPPRMRPRTPIVAGLFSPGGNRGIGAVPDIVRREVRDMKQTWMFDRAAGEHARDEAIARIAKSNEEWLARVAVLIEKVAALHREFTTDDVWREVAYSGIGYPTDNRAMGPAMDNACADGIIAPLESWRLSDQRVCHRRAKRRWRSLI